MTAITLEFPVTHDGTTYTQIDVSNPEVGVIEIIQEAAPDTPEPKLTFLMVSLFAGVPIDVVRKLRRMDFERIVLSINPDIAAPGAHVPLDVPSSVGTGTSAPPGAAGSADGVPSAPTSPPS